MIPRSFGPGELDMANRQEIDQLVRVLQDAAPQAEKAGMILGLESYLSAADNLKILERIGSSAVKVSCDVGNSTDKGRDVLKETSPQQEILDRAGGAIAAMLKD